MFDMNQSIDYVRDAARHSVENFAQKADPPQKKRFYRFFSDGPDGFSRGSDYSSGAHVQLTSLEEAEKELELQNWKSSYSKTNDQLGDTLKQVQRRAQGDKVGILQV